MLPQLAGGRQLSGQAVRSIKASRQPCSQWGNSPKAALLFLGLLALGGAGLLLFPAREVEVYGSFSRDDLSQIKHVALRHTRVVALGNLRRSILKPTHLPDALREVLTNSESPRWLVCGGLQNTGLNGSVE